MWQKIVEGNMLLIMLFSGFIGSLSGSGLLLDCAVAKMARGRKIEVKDSDRCMKEFPEASRAGGAYHKLLPSLAHDQVVELTKKMLPYEELPDHSKSHIAFAKIQDPRDSVWKWFCIESLQEEVRPQYTSHRAYRESLDRREGPFFTYLAHLRNYVRGLSPATVLQRAGSIPALKTYITCDLLGAPELLKRIVISQIYRFADLLLFDQAYYAPAVAVPNEGNFYKGVEKEWQDVVGSEEPVSFIPMQGVDPRDSEIYRAQPYALYYPNHRGGPFFQQRIKMPEKEDFNGGTLINRLIQDCGCNKEKKWYCHMLGVMYQRGIPVPSVTIDLVWLQRVASYLQERRETTVPQYFREEGERIVIHMRRQLRDRERPLHEPPLVFVTYPE